MQVAVDQSGGGSHPREKSAGQSTRSYSRHATALRRGAESDGGSKKVRCLIPHSPS
jgi:hypothetical protein